MDTPRESVTPTLAAILQATHQTDQRIMLRAPTVRIGRGVTGPYDIIIQPDDLSVSREHAYLVLETNYWVFQDTSRNGSYVNGHLFRGQRVVLKPGDRIQIGKTFDYTFKVISPTHEMDFGPAEPPQPVSGSTESPPSKVGLWVSPSAAIWRDGVMLPTMLSRTEYRLIKYLNRRPGDVCDYDSVIRAVWGSLRDKDSLHELIYRVRRKIEPDPSSPRYLIIRPGIGVVFFPQGVESVSLDAVSTDGT
ncbi:MAG: FHA domain-containing protein [Anaerolineae bacterium]|nr:FHA domain-containing protein [Thermoflexales bacterium]MDW8406367.1 FHA domain-containing protein [Anaerolineae bacterium]